MASAEIPYGEERLWQVAVEWDFGALLELLSLRFLFSASFKRKLRSTAFKRNMVYIFTVLFLYVLNKVFHAFDSFIPFEFAHFYLNDILGGVMFPAYVNAVFCLSRYRFRAKTVPTIVFISLACSLAWEVIAPHFLSNSTADPLDAVCYACGGLIYLFLLRTQGAARRWRSAKNNSRNIKEAR